MKLNHANLMRFMFIVHTYHNTLRILCQAFQIEFDGQDHRCERLLVEEAFKIHRSNKLLVPIGPGISMP